jgi:hypothetical protein
MHPPTSMAQLRQRLTWANAPGSGAPGATGTRLPPARTCSPMARPRFPFGLLTDILLDALWVCGARCNIREARGDLMVGAVAAQAACSPHDQSGT